MDSHADVCANASHPGMLPRQRHTGILEMGNPGIALLLAAFALVVLCHRRSRHNWLVVAGLLLFHAGNVGPFVQDVAEGWNAVGIPVASAAK